ncbi:hypothetical protein N657DRAFT_299236 [Parathielavia appendiculata]|uniref:Uncharacterized protein n=1 Tax=Parathielavia appendiculata TaxID=2587402 RepID=A0AAN6U4D6_9PEZI|nr:hypothetical protein N657DRAFT_299236 [Parathielavia appendiculata]
MRSASPLRLPHTVRRSPPSTDTASCTAAAQLPSRNAPTGRGPGAGHPLLGYFSCLSTSISRYLLENTSAVTEAAPTSSPKHGTACRGSWARWHQHVLQRRPHPHRSTRGRDLQRQEPPDRYILEPKVVLGTPEKEIVLPPPHPIRTRSSPWPRQYAGFAAKHFTVSSWQPCCSSASLPG